jgi:REP element-mobilizing transposase RayT
LREAFRVVKKAHPFKIDAIVILPDHIHTIWTLPTDDCDYSKRWGIIKKHFTQSWLTLSGAEQPVTASAYATGGAASGNGVFWNKLCATNEITKIIWITCISIR